MIRKPHFRSDVEHRFMQRAIDLAIESVDQGGGPFGAVVVRDEMILGQGFNRVTLQKDPTAHAEIVAIREACLDTSSHELTGSQIFTSCEPCPMCLAAIYWARIDRVFYASTRLDAARIGFSDESIYKEVQRDMDSRDIAMTQLMRPQSLEAFRKWTAFPEKRMY